MRYKTYRGKTKKEALLKARMENGNSFYVIKEEEKKFGGIGGLFGRNEHVLTVGIFESLFKEILPKEKNQEPRPLEPRNVPEEVAPTINNQEKNKFITEDIEKTAQEIYKGK